MFSGRMWGEPEVAPERGADRRDLEQERVVAVNGVELVVRDRGVPADPEQVDDLPLLLHREQNVGLHPDDKRRALHLRHEPQSPQPRRWKNDLSKPRFFKRP